MSDRSIRDLELRAARDPGAALELAHALERVGRPADALAALWGGCGDLGVRRATAGIEVERAPVRDPRLAWQVKLDGRDALSTVFVSPLALVAHLTRRNILLDPRTGAKRRDLPGGQVHVVDEVLLVCEEDGHVSAFDAWTGDDLFRVRLPGRARRLVGGGWLVTGFRGQLLGFRHEDPRRAPCEGWRRKSPLAGRLRGAVIGDALVVEDLEQARPGAWKRRLEVLGLDTGEDRFSVADAGLVPGHPLQGDLVLADAWDEGAGARTVALRLDGERAWTWPERVELVGVTRARLVAKRFSGGRPTWLHVLDRATGAALTTTSVDVEAVTAQRVVGEVVHVALRGWDAGDGGLVAAVTLTGERLWSWTPEKLPGGSTLAGVKVLPGRVYVTLHSRREIACLIEAAGAAAP